MISHVGLIKSINNIEYNYHHIPDIVTIYLKFLHKDECSTLFDILQTTKNKLNLQNIINCIEEEVIHMIKIDYNITLYSLSNNIHEINSKKGMPPYVDLNKYANNLYCILNIGSAGLIHFKNRLTNQKFSFTVDDGSLLVVNDLNYEYIRGIPFSTSEITDRYAVLFTFKK
jgi:hypothetical protein